VILADGKAMIEKPPPSLDLTPWAELQKLKQASEEKAALKAAEEKAASSHGTDMNAIKSMLHEFLLPLVLDHPQRLQLQELAIPSLLAPQCMEFEPHRGIFRPQHDQHHQKHHTSSSPPQVSLMC